LLEDFGTSTDVYKTTRNLVRKLGLNVKDVIENIADNPDIDQVDDAFINFAMSPGAHSNKVLSKLIWLHWYEIIEVQGILSNNEKYSATFEEQDVNSAMAWTFHRREATVNPASNLAKYGTVNAKLGSMEIDEYGHTVDDSTLYVFKKLSATSCELIEVANLSGMSAIAYDGFHNIAFTKVDDANFTMPVSWYVIEKLQAKEILEVYPYILRLDLFSIEVTEIAWYKTSAFKVFFQIVMIVVAVYTGYTEGLTWAEILFSVAVNLAVSYIVVEIAIFVAKATGNEYIAAIVAVVAMAYLGGGNYDWSTIDGLTNIVTTFSQGLGAAYSVELKELQQDLDNLIEDYEEQREMLKEKGMYAGQVGGAEFLTLISPDTQLYLGRDVQFNFDLLYDYDNLIGNFYENQLTTEIR